MPHTHHFVAIGLRRDVCDDLIHQQMPSGCDRIIGIHRQHRQVFHLILCSEWRKKYLVTISGKTIGVSEIQNGFAWVHGVKKDVKYGSHHTVDFETYLVLPFSPIRYLPSNMVTRAYVHKRDIIGQIAQ